MGYLLTLLQSPVGPTTVHFWGPAANWALVYAGLADSNKPPEQISRNMTATLLLYSILFMRFAWRVQPRNYFLFSCHTFNSIVQAYLLQKRVKHDLKDAAPVELPFKHLNIIDIDSCKDQLK